MKKPLITILMLATIIVAQKSYTDDSLLRIDHLKYGKIVITIPDGYNELREGSNIYHYEGQLIWMSTCVKDNKYSLHYWTCPNPNTDLETWNYKGKIVIKDGSGRELEAEDPYFYYANNMWYISFENKTEEKEYGLFKISLASYAYDLSDTFWFLGGKYGLAQFGDGFSKDGIYSGCLLNDGKILVFDGKEGIWKEEIGIGFWDDNKYVPNPEPVFTVNDIDQPPSNTGIVLTTGIGDNIFKINDKYIMEIVAYKDWSKSIWEEAQPGVYNGYWSQGLAISDNLESGWEVLDSEIKNQHGKHAFFNMFYFNGWKALATTIDNSNTIYLAEVITESEPPIPPVNDNAERVEKIRSLLDKIELELDEIE